MIVIASRLPASAVEMMTMTQHVQHGLSKQTPTVLVPEILSFSPHFLLDDTINIANDGIARAVDAMEDFLNRWAETRLQHEPDWDADKELEQGLVSFQTLLEFHADIAFDFFEAWSLRNIFAVTPDLPLVAPHHAGLDLDQPPERRQSSLQRSMSYDDNSKMYASRCPKTQSSPLLLIHWNLV